MIEYVATLRDHAIKGDQTLHWRVYVFSDKILIFILVKEIVLHIGMSEITGC